MYYLMLEVRSVKLVSDIVDLDLWAGPVDLTPLLPLDPQELAIGGVGLRRLGRGQRIGGDGNLVRVVDVLQVSLQVPSGSLSGWNENM